MCYYSYYFDQNICCFSLNRKQISKVNLYPERGKISLQLSLYFPASPSCPKDKEMKNISKAFSGKLIVLMIQDRSTVHSEYQPLLESITIISLKQFAIRISLFLHRLLNNPFKTYAFFFKKKKKSFICYLVQHVDRPLGKHTMPLNNSSYLKRLLAFLFTIS